MVALLEMAWIILRRQRRDGYMAVSLALAAFVAFVNEWRKRERRRAKAG
jgi:hypothetical protein